jgi:hypothetical protein
LHNETIRLYQAAIETIRTVYIWNVTMTATRTLPALLTRVRFLGTAMLGAYVLINLILAALAPLTGGWPLWGITAIAVPPMVLGMIYLVIPLARRAMQT